jgi:hypothetical protein
MLSNEFCLEIGLSVAVTLLPDDGDAIGNES